MRITEGNIFEAMRLVLPEHRELMKRSGREESKRKQPVLSEDQQAEMEYILGEALRRKRKIRVTIFGAFQDMTREGVPFIKNGGLRLRADTGIVPIPVEKVTKIEFC